MARKTQISARSSGQEREPDGYDSPWKEALAGYLPDFVELLLPEAFGDIAWEAGFQALDSELREVAGKRRRSALKADSLFRVQRRTGASQLLLVHVEVQTQRDSRLPERMFRYAYRSFDAKGLPVVSVAVLGDANPGWRPDNWGWTIWGCELRLTFPVIKLMDFAGRWDELAASSNPFALIVMAHLRTKLTVHDQENRRLWKTQIVELLFERGRPGDVPRLFRIIDWMMQLDDEQAIIFRNDLERMEADKSMPYVTSIERLARQEGRQEGIATMLVSQLAKRFGPLSDSTLQQIGSAPSEKLERWGVRLLDARSLDEVFA